MKWWALLLAVCVGAMLLVRAADPEPSAEERLARHRNLGKAFYENPTTQKEAVEEFRKALQLAPKSPTDQLNLALALLRAGQTDDAVARLEAIQQLDPKLPHTWFNLGIHHKKQGENEKALVQLEQMVKLVPDEPIAHYNLGAVYKALGRSDEAIREFEITSKLDPNLAAPHFQLFNMYRIAGRGDDAKREIATFQQMKKLQEGAVIPEDVEWSSWAEVYDVMADAKLPKPSSALKYSARTLPGTASGAAAIDLNGDGKPEVLTWSNAGLRVGATRIEAKLESIRKVIGIDIDNDGLPEVCVLTANGAVLLANRRGSLAPSPTALPPGNFADLTALDYDHDYDLDLLLAGPKPLLLRNQGPAGFTDRTTDLKLSAGVSVAAFRLVADTKGWDIIVSRSEGSAIVYRDRLQSIYEQTESAVPAGAQNLTPADLDNDGWIDLAFLASDGVWVAWNKAGVLQSPTLVASQAAAFALTDSENRGALDIVINGTAYRNLGGRQFESPISIEATSNCRAITAAEVDGDGRSDLVCTGTDSVSILSNQTAGQSQWIGIRIAGVKNLKLPVGSEVEVKAGARYQKRLYEGSTLIFGLGSEKVADAVRITWPNGLIQNEVKQPAGKIYSFAEAQRLSGSCPMIWTWNGAGFEYITDVLGVAPLGASAGDGEYFPVDHDEYIQIPGRSLVEQDGGYEIRITEELSEVAYLDQIKLFAIDHPADEAIFTNDKFKGPPFPEFRLFGVRQRKYPVAARDYAGRDVLTRITKKDRAYPDSFPRDLSGVGQLHHIQLDFGRAAAANKSILVLNGWVDWADGSTFLGLSQQGNGGLVTPYLQVKNAGGEWETVIQDMGMPAGKPKTIVVDLTGKFLSASREVRIVTNLCVYWDEIFLSEETGPPEVTMLPASTLSADLRFRGFSPVTIHPERKQPEHFSYAGPKPVSMWNPTPGLYTRYGDVHELATAIDDKLIVMGSGDEIRLRFASPGPVKPGWTRDFLLLVDGWAKDRDPNTAYSQSTGPLPFHKMSRFPYPPNEFYPNDEDHQAYVRNYNTRPALRLIRPMTGNPGTATYATRN